MIRPFYPSHEDHTGSEGDRRLLLVSYHFPPSRAVGGLRWQKFARHFVDAGWQLDVVTLSPGDLEEPDPGRLEDLPPGVRVYGVPEATSRVRRFEERADRLLSSVRDRVVDESAGDGTSDDRAGRPTSRYRAAILSEPFEPRDLLRTYRAWIESREGRRWASGAERAGRELASGTDYDVVVSTGPPHFAHRAGRRLAEAMEAPLVIDLRDPWSLDPWMNEEVACRLWLRLAEREEQRCVTAASLVAVNTENHAERLRELYPEAEEKIVVVMNGYDEEELERISGEDPDQRSDRFLVSYVGTIYGQRDPRPFFRAAGEFVRRRSLTPGQFGIELIGHVRSYDGGRTADMAESEGLSEHLSLVEPRPRGEALRRARRASMLLSLPQNTDLCIPAKLFEYMMLPCWVLALEPEGSATERLLRETGADVVPPEDVGAIVGTLERRYRQWSDGRRPERICSDDRFSRRAQAGRLLDGIRRLLSGRQESLPR